MGEPMPNHRNKLYLTWIGKENRPKLEPRVLIEDPARSYHAAHRVSENDIFDNRLIFDDNPSANRAAGPRTADILSADDAGQVPAVQLLATVADTAEAHRRRPMAGILEFSDLSSRLKIATRGRLMKSH